MRWGERGQHCYQFSLSGALAPELEEESGPVMGVLGLGPYGRLTVGTDALDDASYDVEGMLIQRIGWSQVLVPSEPVGVGARWHFSAEGHLRGEALTIGTAYSLVSWSGSQLRVAVHRSVDRPAQTVRDRKGRPKSVEALRTVWRGFVEFDLQRSVLPSARWFDENGREIEQIRLAWRR